MPNSEFEPPERELHDIKDRDLTISCEVCSRAVDTTALRAINKYGWVRVGEFLRRLAIDRFCERAIRSSRPGSVSGVCGIRCVSREVPTDPPDFLGDACNDGWRLMISCASEHAGLKSMRPCLNSRVSIDVKSMVASLGPYTRIQTLYKQMRCPMCGRLGVDFDWYLPRNAARRQA